MRIETSPASFASPTPILIVGMGSPCPCAHAATGTKRKAARTSKAGYRVENLFFMPKTYRGPF